MRMKKHGKGLLPLYQIVTLKKAENIKNDEP